MGGAENHAVRWKTIILALVGVRKSQKYMNGIIRRAKAAEHLGLDRQ